MTHSCCCGHWGEAAEGLSFHDVLYSYSRGSELSMTPPLERRRHRDTCNKEYQSDTSGCCRQVAWLRLQMQVWPRVAEDVPA